MRNIKLLIEYDGSAYQGWQRQAKGRTIQGMLEDKLSRITGETVVLYGAGRTDAGVHALGQAANFHTSQPIPTEALQKALNRLLPKDIVIKSGEVVAADFHARYSAKSKTYLYRILTGQCPSAFERRHAWHIPCSLDIQAMETAAQSLLGTHHFGAFQGSGSSTKTAVRSLYDLSIETFLQSTMPWDKELEGRLLSVRLRANGFLRHMVRNILGTLVKVGRGKLAPGEIPGILASRDRCRAGPTAPPYGLYLAWIEY